MSDLILNDKGYAQSITEVKQVQQLLSVYPNPSIDGVYYLDTNLDPEEMRLMDINGREAPFYYSKTTVKTLT